MNGDHIEIDVDLIVRQIKEEQQWQIREWQKEVLAQWEGEVKRRDWGGNNELEISDQKPVA